MIFIELIKQYIFMESVKEDKNIIHEKFSLLIKIYPEEIINLITIGTIQEWDKKTLNELQVTVIENIDIVLNYNK